MVKKSIYILFVVSISFMVFYCSSEGPGGMRMSSEERAAQLKERLSLTDEQVKQVVEIYAESRERMAEYREKFQADRELMRDVIRENRMETDKIIEEILTEEQKVLFKEYQDEREEQRREWRSGRRDRE